MRDARAASVPRWPIALHLALLLALLLALRLALLLALLLERRAGEDDWRLRARRSCSAVVLGATAGRPRSRPPNRPTVVSGGRARRSCSGGSAPAVVLAFLYGEGAYIEEGGLPPLLWTPPPPSKKK